MTLAMIDEASYQDQVWTSAALHSHGIKVVWVKATEGTYYVSPPYAWQAGQARAAGCVVIHAHVAAYGDSTAEAAYFMSHADVRPGELAGLDNEWAAAYLQKLNPAAGAAWIGAWNKTVKAHLRVPRIPQYTSRDPILLGYFRSIATLVKDGKVAYAGEPLFLADPGADPKGPFGDTAGWPVSFLQYKTLRQAGVTTDGDAAYYGSEADLRKLGVPGARAPDPGPRRIVAHGAITMKGVANGGHCKPSDVILATAFERLTSHMLTRPPEFGHLEAAYLDAGDWSAPLPAGSVWWVP